MASEGEKLSCIAIPAWNCAPFIDEVIERINALLLGATIIVVDDHSSDDTSARAQRHANTVVHRNERNLGYGGTTTRLYEIARELNAGYVINLHGDLGHRPEDIPDLLTALQTGKGEFVVGSRLVYLMEQFSRHGLRVLFEDDLRGHMPLARLVGHFGLTAVQNLLFGLNLHSYHEGMRGCSRTALDWILSQNLPQWYDYDTTLLALAAASGFSIAEIPSLPHYGVETRSAAPMFHYGMRVLSNTIKSAPGVRATKAREMR